MEIWSHCVRDWGNGHGEMPYEPFPAAVEIHKSKARILTLAAGNRFAKSLIASMEAVAALMNPGTKIWVLGPTLRITDNEWEYILECITNTPLRAYIEQKAEQMSVKKKIRVPSKLIKAVGGQSKSIEIKWPGYAASKIEQKSYGKSQNWLNLEGASLSMIIFAEGSRVPLQVWERHLKKRLADKAGRVIIPATPKGKDEFLYPAYERGLSERLEVHIDWNNKKVKTTNSKVDKSPYHVDVTKSYMESYETFQYPGYVNPYYNMKSYESDLRLLFSGKLDESTFKERNFGCFVSFSGSFFRGVDWDKCIAESIEIPDNATHYVAIDPGRATRAAVLWIAVCEPDDFGVEQWYVYDELYQKGLWAQKLAELILDMNRYPIELYIADQTITRDTNHAERTVERQLIDCGVTPLTVPHKRPRTIDSLNRWKPLLLRGQIKISERACPNLVRELKELEYGKPIYKDGKTKQNEVLNDACDMHCIDALTYAFLCRLRWKRKAIETPSKPNVFAENGTPAHKNSFYSLWRKTINKDPWAKIGSY